jgi:hypothetical protein
MKNVLLLLLLVNSILISQTIKPGYFEEKGEVYFKFKSDDKSILHSLTNIISIDNFKNDTVFAYANEKEFSSFLKFGISYEVLKHPGDVDDVRMSSSIEDIKAWDSYPTYDAYVQMMYQFQTQYPDLCRIIDAGTTVQGRKILFAKISDNVDIDEDEPEFMYSSSMHGDETTGYILTLRLIDSLLSTYNSNARIKNLVDNIEIWINPLGNPDGTYRSGNTTVNGATRYNANNIDINRNFPDPAAGQHPDGNAWQPETITMMNLAEAKNFVLSANFHGGEEVLNYPWDTWSRTHADNAWFIQLSRRYADTTHLYCPSSYMNGFDNGITNGYAWYRVTGGRQDYFTYFARGREVTIEISDTKLLAGSLLPAHWEYNKRSLLNYMEECLYGIRGVITSSNGGAVKAKIAIHGHDFDNSEIYSDSLVGNYHRMIYPGTYTVIVSADSHQTQTISNVVVANRTATVVNVQLQHDNPIPVELIGFTAESNGNQVTLNWITATETNNMGFEVERSEKQEARSEKWENIGFVEGNGTTTETHNYSFVDECVKSGKYSYRLKQIDFDGTYSYSNEISVETLHATSLPTEYALYQNYPNPFNPVTTIKYSIPSNVNSETSNTKLVVFDILGNEVAKLVNENKEPGFYEVLFDANKFGLSSGTYFYKLTTGEFVQTKKLLLLK